MYTNMTLPLIHLWGPPFLLKVELWVYRGLTFNFDKLTSKEFNLSSHDNTQSFKHAINFNKQNQVHYEITNNIEIPLLDFMIIP